VVEVEVAATLVVRRRLWWCRFGVAEVALVVATLVVVAISAVEEGASVEVADASVVAVLAEEVVLAGGGGGRFGGHTAWRTWLRRWTRSWVRGGPRFGRGYGYGRYRGFGGTDSVVGCFWAHTRRSLLLLPAVLLVVGTVEIANVEFTRDALERDRINFEMEQQQYSMTM